MMHNAISSIKFRRTFIWPLLAAAALLVMAGCAPRFASDEGTIPQSGDLAISLPAIVLDVDEQGQLSISGVPVSELGAALGQDLSAAELPSMLVGLLTQANVQHLQLTNTGNSLSILANGQELPSISWDSGSLNSTAQLLSELGVLDQGMAQLLPLLEQAGVGVVLNLPLQEGAERLPLVDDTPSEELAAAQESQNRFLSAVQNRVPSINLTINYDSTGAASIEGIPTFLLGTLGISLDALNQDPAVIQQLQDADVQSITMSSNADGAGITVNGQTLPYIDWSGGKVVTLIDVLTSSGALDSVSERPQARDAILNLIKEIIPIVQAADLNLTVNIG